MGEQITCSMFLLIPWRGMFLMSPPVMTSRPYCTGILFFFFFQANHFTFISEIPQTAMTLPEPMLRRKHYTSPATRFQGAKLIWIWKTVSSEKGIPRWGELAPEFRFLRICSEYNSYQRGSEDHLMRRFRGVVTCLLSVTEWKSKRRLKQGQ